jgi:hypothetical protein
MEEKKASENKNEISQEEIDSLNIKHHDSLLDDVRNLIILIRNELNIVDKEAHNYNDVKIKNIKKKLNKVYDKIIHIRK